MGLIGDVAKNAIKKKVVKTIVESKPVQTAAGAVVATSAATLHAAATGLEKLDEHSKKAHLLAMYGY